MRHLTILLFATFSHLILLPYHGYAQKIIGEIHFETAKWEIDSIEQIKCIELAASITSDGTSIVELHGYCDNRGSFSYNQHLSEQRAMSVYQHMHDKIPANTQVTYSGHSYEDPTASNKTSEGRALNRRVQLTEGQARKTGTINIANYPKDQLGKVIIYDTAHKELMRVYINGGSAQIPILPQAEYYVVTQNQTPLYFKPSTVSKGLSLTSLEKDLAFRLKNIGFVPNETTFLPEAYPALESLLAVMRTNPTLVIHIEGHTNGVGTKRSDEWHMNTSTGRAQAVKNYLIENDIEANRMTFEGFGCSRMINPETRSKIRMKANRRVEIVVKDI